MAEKGPRTRYVFHRPLVQSEIEILQSCIASPESHMVRQGECVVGFYGRGGELADFQDILRTADCSKLFIAVAEAAKAKPIIAAPRRAAKRHRKERISK